MALRSRPFHQGILIPISDLSMTLLIGNACRRRMQECAQHLSKTRVNRQQFLSRVEEGRRRQFHATIGRWEPSRSDLGNHLQSTYGIDPKLHAGIFKALEPVYGPNLTEGHLDAFGKTGLVALAASVEQQLVKRRGAAKRPSRVLKVSIPHHKTSFEVDWKLGDSLLDVARSHDEMFAEYMEGTCGGNMSCCTCHVYIDQPEFQALLKAPEEAELDMLDLAYDPQESSRLGCQVKLTKELIDCPTPLEIRIPNGVNNVWN